MNLFFDFDGTLIDSRERLYQLFRFLVPGAALSFQEYWDLKRNKINHRQILSKYFSFSEEQTILFEQEWFSKIEQPEWLGLDKPFGGVTELLTELYDTHRLFLVTSRQFDEGVDRQLASFGWDNIFTKKIITHQLEDKAVLVKKLMVTGKDDWFIGDTGKDIEAGKTLGIKTAAVLSGFRNKHNLEVYKPTVILETVLDIRSFI